MQSDKPGKFIIETERLLLFEQTVELAADIFALYNDWDVVRFTEDNLISTPKEVINKIKKYDHYRKYGFGKWAVIKKNNGEFIGLSGLKHYEEYDKTALSYSFLKKYWGNGYATEAAIGVLKHAFGKLNFERVIAWTTPDNKASIRVLQKSGFNYVRDEKWDDKVWEYYRIDKNHAFDLYTS